MKITATAAELTDGYEALRAQALGQLPGLTPRGLAVFIRGGLPGWMVACAPAPGARAARSPADIIPARRLAGVSAELVRVLTEMALGSQRRCWA